MRVLIVEDEQVVARRLERLLRELMGDELVALAVCDDTADAMGRLEVSPFDLVLLDLDVRGRDGFEVLRRAVSGKFHTVVVSAHTERALEAFELGVLDFVPKPFAKPRLGLALERVRGTAAPHGRLRQLAVRSSGSVVLLSIDEVRLLRGADDYTEVHLTSGEVHLHDKTLARLEALLPPRFARVHRSFIVDLGRVRELRSKAGSRYSLVLDDGSEVPVGRTRVRALRERLEVDR